MTEPSAERIAEIRARLEAATPGPWKTYPHPTQLLLDNRRAVFIKDRTVCATTSDGGGLMAVAYCDYMTPEYAERNAALIANAPADIAFLLSREKAARAEGTTECLLDISELLDEFSEPAMRTHTEQAQVEILLMARSRIRALLTKERT